MATILSLKTVSEIKGSRLTMDTAVIKGIKLTLENGDSYTFNMYENGLYFFDTKTQIILLKVNLSYPTTHFSKLLHIIKTFLETGN